MNDKESFERIRTARGLKWILPTRDTSGLSALGWLLVGVGCLTTVFMLVWIAGPFSIGARLLAGGQQFGWLPIAFSMLGFGGLRFALRFLILGMKILRNTTRSEIEISGDYLIAKEKIGWFDWRRKVKLKEIQTLKIIDKELGASDSKGYKGKRKSNTSSLPIDIPNTQCLMAEDTEGKETAIAILHSVEFLESLAHEISTAVEPLRMGATSAGIAVATLIASKKSQGSQPKRNEGSISIEVSKAGKEQPPKRPESCKIVELEEADGTIGWEVPATGYRGIARFLLLFGLFWTGLSSLAFVSIASELFAKPFDWEAVFGAGFTALFVLIGVAILLAARYWATYRLFVGAVDGLLMIQQLSAFRTKTIDFPLDSISYIEVGPGKVEVNHEPVSELKIGLQDGEEHGMLGGRDEAELEWFAFRLIEQLDLKGSLHDGPLWQKQLGVHDADQFSRVELPEGSRLVVSQNETLNVSVPAYGWSKMLPTLVATCIIGPIPLLIYLFAIQEFMLIPFGVAFILISIGVNIAMAVHCFRSFKVNADGVDLSVTRQGVFGSKTWTWHRGAIQDIDLNDSGVIVNGKKLYQLSIDAQPKLSLMTGWEQQEIAYVAGLLNQALGLIVEAEYTATEQA